MFLRCQGAVRSSGYDWAKEEKGLFHWEIIWGARCVRVMLKIQEEFQGVNTITPSWVSLDMLRKVGKTTASCSRKIKKRFVWAAPFLKGKNSPCDIPLAPWHGGKTTSHSWPLPCLDIYCPNLISTVKLVRTKGFFERTKEKKNYISQWSFKAEFPLALAEVRVRVRWWGKLSEHPLHSEDLLRGFLMARLCFGCWMCWFQISKHWRSQHSLDGGGGERFLQWMGWRNWVVGLRILNSWLLIVLPLQHSH